MFETEDGRRKDQKNDYALACEIESLRERLGIAEKE